MLIFNLPSKHQHKCQITAVLAKINELSVLLNNTSMLKDGRTVTFLKKTKLNSGKVKRKGIFFRVICISRKRQLKRELTFNQNKKTLMSSTVLKCSPVHNI